MKSVAGECTIVSAPRLDAVDDRQAADAALASVLRARMIDYVELTKPRIAILVLVTVAAGYCLAAGSGLNLLVLLHVLVGTGLVAAGASALNQLLERHSDARMQRTENRPLPAGRLQAGEVLLFGLLLAGAGLLYLAIQVQQPLCVAIAALTFIAYVGVYTPLKRTTTLNTLVGAVPGALPPLIGWAASGEPLTIQAAVLFLILFLWQVPHFLAIAWIYREDYQRAGLKMLPVVDESGKMTAQQMMLYCGCLALVSLLPVTLGFAGIVYLAGVVGLGTFFLWTTVLFAKSVSVHGARLVLRASLIYLPAVLLLMLLDGFAVI